MNKDRKMKISELELESGVPRTRINYYLRQGFLHQPEKTGLTMAYYDQSHVERLKVIEKIKMDYLNESGKYRMPASLLKLRLQEYTLPTEGKDEEESSAQESDFEFSVQREQDIIDAAAKLNAKHGYYHTSLRDIAREAGISPSTIYLYFPNKRELFGAVIDQIVDRLNKEVKEVMTAGTDPWQAVISSLQVYGDYFPLWGEILYQLRAGLIVNDEWAKLKIRDIYDRIAGIVKVVYRYAMDIGIMRELDLDLLTYYAISVTEASFQRRDLDDKYTFEELRSFFLDVFFNGVGTSKQIS
jgi:AcrR family transcriptional regulator